ncbi:hypothetical protein [Corynebacterium bovis]|uniref:hypothetical protein n=1 Tax=Corynebacterium bovis TaxID=36808 RepID=UPI0021AB1868|nr:hypothetical protein [Corynebacterium bovis]
MTARWTAGPRIHHRSLEDLMGFMDKAKDAVTGNRETIEQKAGEAIDSKLDGDKAGKAKDALKTGLDKLSGQGSDDAANDEN